MVLTSRMSRNVWDMLISTPPYRSTLMPPKKWQKEAWGFLKRLQAFDNILKNRCRIVVESLSNGLSWSSRKPINPYFMRVSLTIVSTCPVAGNISTGQAPSARYPIFLNTPRSRARVSGPQET